MREVCGVEGMCGEMSRRYVLGLIKQVVGVWRGSQLYGEKR